MTRLAVNVTILAAAMLTGCAVYQPYTPPAGTQTALLRVAATTSGNTLIGVLELDKCRSEEARMLGWFHPLAFAEGHASRRGFDRKLDMPDGSRFPRHMFAEHTVQADTTLRIIGSNVGAGPIMPGSFSMCEQIIEVTLSANKSYEFVFQDTARSCVMQLFELQKSAGGAVSRRPMETTPACKAPGK